jgi:3-oxoacyl-(acyl-carrier-protein) synthase
MIELLLALQTATSPIEAECETIANFGRRFSGRQIRSLQADCSASNADPALQVRANETLAQIDLNLRWNRVGQYASAVVFEQDEAGRWQPLPGQIVILTVPQFPPPLVERGSRNMTCDYALWPNALGQPVNIASICYLDGADTDRDRRLAERAMIEALENSRLLPLDYGYCFTDGTSVTAQVLGESTSTQPEARTDTGRVDLCRERDTP